ncbi:YjgN family protein [Arhodomonas sp. AD133]|uniref:YjgN family protein n=1 Tax=Arhodomonas sp. AD133 TaxID=3415009 RepID=UPI003EB8BA7E
MNNAHTDGARGRIAHHGRGGELFVIFIVNLLLKIITFGIYQFWAKTRIRRYLWSQTSFDGERLEYTGTGLELFLGFLKAVAIMFLVAIAASILTAVAGPVGFVALVVVYVLGFPVLAGAARFAATRYRFSRTRLRSIRFGLVGSAWSHGFLMMGLGLLSLLTLGLYTPFARMKLAGNVLNNTYYGSERFRFHGKGSDLFLPFLLALLLTVPTLGLVWLWYRASEFRYVASQLEAGELRFEVTQSPFGLAVFFLTNVLIVIVTLGLGLPWVMVRTIRHIGETMEVTGELDYQRIMQEQRESEAVGEGFAEALDVGAI